MPAPENRCPTCYSPNWYTVGSTPDGKHVRCICASCGREFLLPT